MEKRRNLRYHVYTSKETNRNYTLVAARNYGSLFITSGVRTTYILYFFLHIYTARTSEERKGENIIF